MMTPMAVPTHLRCFMIETLGDTFNKVVVLVAIGAYEFSGLDPRFFVALVYERVFFGAG
jgi:hypothetical protein